MYTYVKPTLKEKRKMQSLLRTKIEPVADLILFVEGDVMDRAISLQKPFNVANGLKKTLIKKNPHWENYLRVITPRMKDHLELKY